MKPDEIREKSKHYTKYMTSGFSNNFVFSVMAPIALEMIIEIAAQLAELNETLKSKQLVAHAHLHTSGPSDPYDGLA